MGDAVNNGVETVESGLERRQFIQRAGVGAAVAGGAWVAPSIIGTSVAFAAGSNTEPTVPPTTDPANLLCGVIDWPEASVNNPANVGSNITFPITSTGTSGVSLLSVNGSTARPLPAVVAGTNPPSANYPLAVQQGGAIGGNNNFKVTSQV